MPHKLHVFTEFTEYTLDYPNEFNLPLPQKYTPCTFGVSTDTRQWYKLCLVKQYRGSGTKLHYRWEARETRLIPKKHRAAALLLL